MGASRCLVPRNPQWARSHQESTGPGTGGGSPVPEEEESRAGVLEAGEHRLSEAVPLGSAGRPAWCPDRPPRRLRGLVTPEREASEPRQEARWRVQADVVPVSMARGPEAERARGSRETAPVLERAGSVKRAERGWEVVLDYRPRARHLPPPSRREPASSPSPDRASFARGDPATFSSPDLASYPGPIPVARSAPALPMLVKVARQGCHHARGSRRAWYERWPVPQRSRPPDERRATRWTLQAVRPVDQPVHPADQPVHPADQLGHPAGRLRHPAARPGRRGRPMRRRVGSRARPGGLGRRHTVARERSRKAARPAGTGARPAGYRRFPKGRVSGPQDPGERPENCGGRPRASRRSCLDQPEMRLVGPRDSRGRPEGAVGRPREPGWPGWAGETTSLEE